MIFDDFTASVRSGVYLFEDVARLDAEGNSAEANAARRSIVNLCIYIPQTYPGFIRCKPTPKEWDDLMEVEEEKVREDIRQGKERPTPDQWEQRVATKRSEIFARHRKDIGDVTFRVTKNGEHVGALFFTEIMIGRTTQGITELDAQPTFAIDIGATDNDAWHRLCAELTIWMLKNPFFSILGDARDFRMMTLTLPDMYDDQTEPANAEAIRLIEADGIVYDEYPLGRRGSPDVKRLRRMRLP